MDLAPYINGLEAALRASAQTSSPDVQEAAERLAQSLEPAVRLTLMEVVSDTAAEATARLDGDLVEVRLRGGSPEIVVERALRGEGAGAPLIQPTPPAPPLDDEGGGVSRISLRLPESLKAQVDQAAAVEGCSVNTWLIRAVQQALVPTAGLEISSPGGHVRVGRSMTGWAH